MEPGKEAGWVMTGMNKLAPNVIADQGTYIAGKIVTYWEKSKLYIGRYCSIGRGLTVYLGGEHPTDLLTTYPFHRFVLNKPDEYWGEDATKGDIYIGHGTWIGDNVTIMSGTMIGNCCIIGANSIVRGRVPSYAIGIGNPFRVQRYLFTNNEMDILNKIMWWEWPKDLLNGAIPILMSHNDGRTVDALKKYYDEHKIGGK